MTKKHVTDPNAFIAAYMKQTFNRAAFVDAAEMQEWLYAHEQELPRNLRGLLFQVQQALHAHELFRDQAAGEDARLRAIHQGDG
ncbi:MAG: hypothetical protein GX547_16270 [Phycisphaerae bacterium]|nr:hypothetical protein [Phycisphaerae bacterium]